MAKRQAKIGGETKKSKKSSGNQWRKAGISGDDGESESLSSQRRRWLKTWRHQDMKRNRRRRQCGVGGVISNKA